MNKQRIIRTAIAALMLGAVLGIGAAQSRAANNICSSKSASWTEQTTCRGKTSIAVGTTNTDTGESKVALILTKEATGEGAGAVGLSASGNVVCSTGLIGIPGNTGKTFWSGRCVGGKYVGLQHLY